MAKPLSEQEAAHVRTVFARFDANGDGHISRAELVAGLKQLNLPAEARQVEALLERLDSDHDGSVTLREFEAFVRLQRAELRALFEALDADGDGFLSEDEVRRSLQRLGLPHEAVDVRRFMRRMDVNRDHQIDFDEWQRFLMLVPAANLRAVLSYWEDAVALDPLGEGELVPLPGEGIGIGIGGGTPSAAPPTAAAAQSQLQQVLRGFAAGGIAGAVSRTGTAPLERLKILYQVQHGRTGGLWQGMKEIYADGGIRGLWRGNGANVLKIVPEYAVRFYVYDRVKLWLAPDGEASVSVAQRMTAGAVAGGLSLVAIYPMDVVKTRLAASMHGQYSGIVDVVRQIVRNEGAVRPFFRGISVGLVSTPISSALHLTLFDLVKDAAVRAFVRDGESPGSLLMMGCGMTSSLTAQLLTYPVHLIKTRLQTQGMHPHQVQYRGFFHGIATIVRTEGLRALYKGLLPSMLKHVPTAGLSFAAYSFCREFLGLEGDKKHGHGKH